MDTYDEAPILKRAAEQIAAGAAYLDVNIGPAESNGPELMTWAVQLLQQNFNNVPLALDTANMAAIEAGIKVYNRSNGKPIVNSADADSRIGYIDLATTCWSAACTWACRRTTCGSTPCSWSSRACRISRWTCSTLSAPSPRRA